ncbi:MAG: transporter substrate-binding domain-containing protein [Pseudomonadales bacterium]|nr:transporter substrate-binding domain-containing protein [Pseudomonadales bacterium]
MLALLLAGLAEVGAEEGPKPELRVAAKVAPPFVERQADGTLGGFAIEFWEAIAERIDVETDYRETELPALFDAVADGSADVGVGALTMTAERERRVDFTHPWLQAGLAIAVPVERSGWVAVARRVLSMEFLSVVGALLLLLLLFGGAVWLVERRRNPAQFGGSAVQGVGEGIWWAAVTMTTVGYGDRAPVTWPGRVIALLWMFAALVLISTFTAAITTALTVGQLESPVRNAADLGRARVLTVAASSSATWLADRSIRFRTAPDLGSALDRLADGEADALVYDEPLLRYQLAQRDDRVRVVPGSFDRQAYAFALAEEDPRREAVDLAILELLEEPYWQSRLDALVP